MSKEKFLGVVVGTAGAWAVIAVTLGGLYGCPEYNVWQKGKLGESELAQADWNRQVAMLEAKAKMESARSLAEAEVIRAGGVAQANKIIGDSLRENEDYLRYLWVQQLDGAQMQVIYIPTEAGMPLLEAGKRRSK